MPSPDGKQLVFVSDRTGYLEVYVSNSDGSQQRRLTELRAASGSPSWSPDGRKICFDVFSGDENDIYIVNVLSGISYQLTTNPAEDVTPSWSRDGEWVYFASLRSGRYEAWRIPAEGGEAVQVTQNGGFYTQESPDGYLYYTKTIRGEIWRTPKDGGEEILVLDRAVRWEDWVLTSDGIYFMTRHRAGTGWVWKVEFLDLATRDIDEVYVQEAKTSSDNLGISPDERWFYTTALESGSGTDIMLVENFR
jgi:Tol biopolymer transport system component